MRYSTEPKFRKYVKEYGLLLFARKFSDKYSKTMDTATKTGIVLLQKLPQKELFKKVQKQLEICLAIK